MLEKFIRVHDDHAVEWAIAQVGTARCSVGSEPIGHLVLGHDSTPRWTKFETKGPVNFAVLGAKFLAVEAVAPGVFLATVSVSGGFWTRIERCLISMTRARALHNFSEETCQVVATSDDLQVALLSMRGELVVVRADDSQLRLPAPSPLHALALSTDGGRLVAAFGMQVRAWSTLTGEVEGEWSLSAPAGRLRVEGRSGGEIVAITSEGTERLSVGSG